MFSYDNLVVHLYIVPGPAAEPGIFIVCIGA
jgi:hypothetical protein